MDASKHIPPWSQIETVCLDMDGTLLDLAFDNRFWLETVPRLYAQAHRLDERSAYERVMAMYASQKGQLNWYCVDYWSEQLRLPLMEHKHLARQTIQIRPGVKAFLQWLENSNKTCYLVTNAHPKVLALKLQHTRIDLHFDAVVSAHHLGLAKEEPGFWKAFSKRFPMRYETTLFVDDSPTVLQAAEQCGIRFLYQIAQPDLTQPAVTEGPYPLVDNFFAMMPISANKNVIHDR